MVTTKFTATQQGDGGETITLLRELPGGLFRRASSETVPVAEWPKVAPEAGQAALALARSFDHDGQILEDERAVVLPPQIVASLDEADAFALGLPPATSLTLQLNSGGSLSEGTIKVNSKWVRRGGLPVRADIAGARIREGGRVARIPEPVFSVFQASLAVNAAADPDERRAAFAQLREQLGDEIGTGIQADGFLERIRIAYAANFSLNAKTDHGRFDFDPVLFSRNVGETSDGDLVDEDEASLLTPQDTQHFQRRFRGQEGGRRSYLLSDGTLLFLDPLLGKALDIVRSKQAGSSQEKREFLRSPQRVLRDELKLDATGDDEAADRLFIETQQFSERVSGIEVWQKPVLPWIKPKPNSWLPEGFGLRIGDPPNARHIELAPGEAETIADDVETAIEAGSETIAWHDENIPATLATLKAARAIADLERQIASESGGPSPGEVDREPIEIFFLQVGENFEQLDYARLPRPKSDSAPFKVPALPQGLKSEPKPHQLDAFAWLTEAWERRLPGVLLADDMGLGKTFQALMFLLWLRGNSAHPKPVLIVAPTGLLRNWQAELAQHVEAGLIGSVVEAFGTNLRSFRLAAGSDIRGGTSRLDSGEWEGAGIVLTTYETTRDRRYECPTRNADIAIREYAPGAEVVVDGLVWKSAGVTLNWLSPIDSGQREPQNLRWAWWCDQCGGAGSDHQMPERCDHCGDPNVKTEQFLEPAGFRVDWNAQPHADTDQAVYIEPKSPKVSVGDALWQPLLQPESGRIRASHDGYIYHHSRGPNDKGYEICLECGRAGEAGTDALKEHRPLTPRDKKAIDRCPGNDQGYAITRPLALGHEVLTDVVEVQLPGLENDDAAWALGAALRESLARWLGIEPRELGIAVAARDGQLGRKTPSIYLFDEASGGAGYTPRLLDDIYHVFERASHVLDCPKVCEMGCSACVLAADLYKQQGRLDRRAALIAVRAFLEKNAELPEEDRAVADAKAVNDAANTILLRARSGDSVTVFLPEAFDLAELSSIKMRSFFSSAAARGVPVTIVLSRKSFDSLAEVERRSLRDTASRNELRLGLGQAEKGHFGNHRIAELISLDGSKAFFSRDENATQPGERWGVGETHAVVAGSINPPTHFNLIAADDLERQVAPGDKVEVMLGFGQCPVGQFGKRFGAKLKQHMEAAGIWHPGQLVRISYSDRYLNAPLPMLLFLRTCETLAAELKSGDMVEVDVVVQPLKKDRAPYRIFNDWDHEGDRADVAQFLGEKLGLDVALEVTESAIHGRKLELEYADGRKALVLLDQGFGYWRIVGNPPRHDFRSAPAAQASDLYRSNAAVSGTGESYFAVTKQ